MGGCIAEDIELIDNAKCAVWLNAPDVPAADNVALVGVAVGEAVSATVCWLAADRVKLAGVAVTPEGTPVIVTLTWPLKPFEEEHDTCMFADEPWISTALLG